MKSTSAAPMILYSPAHRIASALTALWACASQSACHVLQTLLRLLRNPDAVVVLLSLPRPPQSRHSRILCCLLHAVSRAAQFSWVAQAQSPRPCRAAGLCRETRGIEC